MKNLFKLLLTFILVFSLVLSATSCDILAENGIDIGDILDSEDEEQGNTDQNEKPDASLDDSHEHQYKTTRVDSTCQTKGKVTYTCECGHSFSANLELGAHTYVGGACTVCGKVAPDDGEDETPDETPEETPDDNTGNFPENPPVDNEPEDDIPEVTPDPEPEPEPELFEGGILHLPNEKDPITSDPYVNVNVSEFYANYTPAISYMDAYYRTQHNLMSGSIDPQDPTPSFAAYRPTVDGKYVRNTTYLFSEDELTYYVVDSYGYVVNKIYKCGAYVTLEEVAAYVFAFGTYPANHSASKSTKPSASPWKEYLRVNHTKFSGDTSKYPYEPVLPNISGCGGSLQYYEMDIGTTGTDTGNGYDVAVYNNGSTITRGAARIVYTYYDLDRDGIIEVGETYLFYTQNHYNDFREYLNYQGGWGEIFGNETGGGTLSSKYDYNPTPYVETAYYSFVYADGTPIVKVTEVVVLYMPKREEV